MDAFPLRGANIFRDNPVDEENCRIMQITWGVFQLACIELYITNGVEIYTCIIIIDGCICIGALETRLFFQASAILER